MGLTLQFPGFAVIEKRERHTAVGRVPENGKTRYQGRQRTRWHPLIESDDNRELFRKLAQAISNIPGTGTMTIA